MTAMAQSRRQEEQEEQDHVDAFLARHGDTLPVDLETEAIVDRITGLSKRFVSGMEETLADFGLSYGEWKVLTNLRWAGQPYRRTPGQLAKRAELSSGAMTNRLDRLEEAGLVRRLPDRDDRRSVIVELTEKGSEVWQRAVGVQGEKERLVASALDDREKKQLNALLRRLMLVFEAQEPKKSK
jgi:DNA-binding MarR family transcriptional regulator